jgi:hypothetical protein
LSQTLFKSHFLRANNNNPTSKISFLKRACSTYIFIPHAAERRRTFFSPFSLVWLAPDAIKVTFSQVKKNTLTKQGRNRRDVLHRDPPIRIAIFTHVTLLREMHILGNVRLGTRSRDGLLEAS